MVPTPTGYTHEGGRRYLAEALFTAHAVDIRCPACIGNPTRAGFIKDAAGKSTKDGLNRRQWRCQRTNGRAAAGKDCPRVSCTQYIEIARKTLSTIEFEGVGSALLTQSTLTATEKVFIRSYLNPSHAEGPSLKRKVEGEEGVDVGVRKFPRQESLPLLDLPPSEELINPDLAGVVQQECLDRERGEEGDRRLEGRGEGIGPPLALTQPSQGSPGWTTLELVEVIATQVAQILPRLAGIEDATDILLLLTSYVNAIEVTVQQLVETVKVREAETVESSPKSSIVIPETPQGSEPSSGTAPSSITEGSVEELVGIFRTSPSASARTESRRRAKALGWGKAFQKALQNRRG